MIFYPAFGSEGVAILPFYAGLSFVVVVVFPALAHL